MMSDTSSSQIPSPPAPREDDRETFDRKDFLRACGLGVPILFGMIRVPAAFAAQEEGRTSDSPLYGMGIDIEKCIGCGRCAAACKIENDVPEEPYYFNTWVERYVIRENGQVDVDSPNGGIDGFPPLADETNILKSFFVPKLCNHCENPPCVQVCPVGATFSTEEGVVLVDDEYCIGCRYCIQACPYGARYLHPEKRVAAKCTFCYHRLKEGLLPACVEVCPTGARLFGDLESRASPLARFHRFNHVQVLKPHLNTEPKVHYANLDGEVR